MLSASADRDLASAALTGRVAEDSGGPLPGATVKIHKVSGEQFDDSATTDSQGRYSFSELPDGEYLLQAALSGFVSVSYKPVRIYFPAQVQWDFVLRLAGLGHDAVYASSELVGELMSRGVRIPHANICLTKVDGPNSPICTTTNRLGQYFLDVPPSIYVATVDSGGDTKASQRLDLSAAGEYRNKIALPDADQGSPPPPIPKTAR
jgi:hypothetical protein